MIIHYFKGMLLLTISTHLPLLWHIYIFIPNPCSSISHELPNDRPQVRSCACAAEDFMDINVARPSLGAVTDRERGSH